MLATRDFVWRTKSRTSVTSFGADVDQVRLAVASDRRIGSAFLFPGVGYGGSCFPKDVQALVHFASDKDYDFKILGAVKAVNKTQKDKTAAALDARAFRQVPERARRSIGVDSAFKAAAPTTCARLARSRSFSKGLLVRGARGAARL